MAPKVPPVTLSESAPLEAESDELATSANDQDNQSLLGGWEKRCLPSGKTYYYEKRSRRAQFDAPHFEVNAN